MIIKWDYFIDEETEAHKNPSSSLFCEIDPKYMRATHWDALRGWPIFMRCRFLSSFISSYPFFSLLLSSQSLSLPGSSLSFVHFSDLPAAFLGISSSNNDVQTQISKTSFLKVQTLLGACRGSLTWQWHETRDTFSCYLQKISIWLSENSNIETMRRSNTYSKLLT